MTSLPEVPLTSWQGAYELELNFELTQSARKLIFFSINSKIKKTFHDDFKNVSFMNNCNLCAFLGLIAFRQNIFKSYNRYFNYNRHFQIFVPDGYWSKHGLPLFRLYADSVDPRLISVEMSEEFSVAFESVVSLLLLLLLLLEELPLLEELELEVLEVLLPLPLPLPLLST